MLSRQSWHLSTESGPEQLPEVLWSHYGLKRPVRLDRPRKGYSSETWIASLPKGQRAVVRRYPTFFDETRVHFEHEVLRHLKQQIFPVPAIRPTVSGESFVHLDGRYYALFEYCQGRMVTRPLWRRLQPRMLAGAGHTLARFHRVMDGFQPDGKTVVPHRDYRWFQGEVARYHKLVSGRPRLSSFDRYVLEHGKDVERQLGRFGTVVEVARAGCPQTVVHGDFGPTNVLFRNGQIVAVLDFANVRHGPRVTDVAYALMAFSKWSRPRLHLAMARTFLKAYQEQIPLTSKELELLPHLMIYNRLQGLWGALMQYYEKGLLKAAEWFVDTLELVRWLQAHEAKIQNALSQCR